jgi:hypothetical protein
MANSGANAQRLPFLEGHGGDAVCSGAKTHDQSAQ